MKDDALAPVIAAMLILAVIVTCYSAWNAAILPSMKEQAEMTHLRQVEESVTRFSSDIDTAASLKRDMALSERVPLGGGDMILSPLRSGGLLRTTVEDTSYMIVTISTATVSESAAHYMAGYSYRPSGNFWQDLGYDWSYGYINITKRNLETPLEYDSMTDIDYNLAGTLLEFGAVHTAADPAKCSGIILRTVNITADPHHSSASGNGIGTLALGSSQNTLQVTGASAIHIVINSDTPAGFQDSLKDSIWQKSGDLGLECLNVQPVTSGNTIDLLFDADPVVTVIWKRTEILIRAD